MLSKLGVSWDWQTTIENLLRITLKEQYLLTTYLAKNTEFQWKHECELAFQDLKEALIKPPILAFPDFDNEFVLTNRCFRSSYRGLFWVRFKTAKKLL